MDLKKLEATAVIRTNSLDFIEQLFALNAARRPLVMVNDEAQAASLPGIVIDRCITPGDRSGWFADHHPLIHDDLPAQVSYTSGTEGLPKGILLTYRNLADATQRIIDEMQMTDEIREYVGVPATFSFGLGRYRAISAVGGQAYLPPRGFDPMELARMLKAGQVNALSAVPTLLRILLDAPGLIGEAGKKLRWMEIGSQHMTADEKQRIRQMFPNARIVQHYGLTEASRSTFLTVSEAPEAMLDSVGRPTGQTEIELGPDQRIRIRGPHVARWRIDKDGLHDLAGPDGWLQTNDLGHMRDGFLFFDGRADDLINIGGVKVSPDQLEDRIRAKLAPGATIAVAKVPDAQRGDGVLVAVQGDQPPAAEVKKIAVEALNRMGVVAGTALHVETVETIHVTGTGKVQRRALAQAFVDKHPVETPQTAEDSGDIQDVMSLFRKEFPGQDISPQDSFETLGGDSLHYIQFSLHFEQRFGQLPDHWEKMSAEQLENSLGTMKKTSWRKLDSSTLLRAFFMSCIIGLHTDAFVYSPNWGAAYFLILLAGHSMARFQLPEVLRTGSTRTIWGTVKTVAIPTVLAVAFLQVMTQRFEILPLLLVSNYLDPYSLKGFSMYFAEFYLQLLVLAAIFFSFRRVQDAFRTRPMLSAVILSAAVVFADLVIEHFWDGEYNYHRTPWNYAWPFALGIIIALADDPRKKLLALAIVILEATFKWGPTSADAYVIGGSLLLLYVRWIPVPGPVKLVVAEIAGASLFIYLSHEVTMSVVRKIAGTPMPWVEFFASIIIGITVSHVYLWASRLIIQKVSAMRQDEPEPAADARSSRG